MTINFPSSPVQGSTYDYGGVRYTFDLSFGAPGYWAILEPGLAGPASFTEVNSGLDTFKYITSDALENSKYIRGIGVQANGGVAGEVLKDQAINFKLNAAGNGGLAISRSGLDIQFQTLAASTSQRGVVQLSNLVNSTSQTFAGTANAVRVAYNEGIAAARADQSRATNGYLGVSVDKAGDTADQGIDIQWGIMPAGTNGTKRTVTFPRAFATAPYSITMTSYSDVFNASYAYPRMVVTEGRTASSFQFVTADGGNNSKYFWMAIGSKN